MLKYCVKKVLKDCVKYCVKNTKNRQIIGSKIKLPTKYPLNLFITSLSQFPIAACCNLES